jgi:chemotaxis response regulator CheB
LRSSFSALWDPALRALAEHDGDIVVAGEAANGAAGLHKVAECLPDVVAYETGLVTPGSQ